MSDDTHLFRIHEICAANGLDVLTSPRPQVPVAGVGTRIGNRLSHEILELYSMAASSGETLALWRLSRVGTTASTASEKSAALRVERKFTRVVVEPAAPLQSCAEQAVEEQTKDATKQACCQHRPVSAQRKDARDGHEGSGERAGQGAPRLMAPSVPGSMTRSVVIMRGRLFRTWPTSEDTVSAAASQRAARPAVKTAVGANCGKWSQLCFRTEYSAPLRWT